MHVFQRYVLFLLGIVSMGLGIALTTRSDLGTTPISSVPYVLSLALPLSLGTFTFLTLLLFVFLQKLILKKDFPFIQYAQLMIAPLLGMSVDLGMYLTSFLEPTFYLEKIGIVVIGSFFVALGVTLQIEAKTVMNAGEAIVHILANRLRKPFSSVKIYFDWMLVLTGLLLSLALLGGFYGIREGTLIAAFLVGLFVKWIHFFSTMIHCRFFLKGSE